MTKNSETYICDESSYPKYAEINENKCLHSYRDLFRYFTENLHKRIQHQERQENIIRNHLRFAFEKGGQPGSGHRSKSQNHHSHGVFVHKPSPTSSEAKLPGPFRLSKYRSF